MFSTVIIITTIVSTIILLLLLIVIIIAITISEGYFAASPRGGLHPIRIARVRRAIFLSRADGPRHPYRCL